MLIEFKVKNYLSIKDEQILSLEPSSDRYLSDYHCIDINPETKILRMCLIYGANASGKSNLLLALDFLRKTCLEPKERNEKTNFLPFAFDKQSTSEPGYFEISFFADSKKYVYSLCIDNQFIHKEKLVFYTSAQPSMIFNREFQPGENDYTLKTGSKIKINPIELSVLKSNTLNNMSIISGLSKTNIRFPELNAAYNWFHDTLKAIIKPSYDLFNETIQNIIHRPKEFKDFIFNGLEKADFNITDIYIEPDNKIMSPYQNMDVLEDISSLYGKRKVHFIHQNKIGKVSSFDQLDARFQSAGTLKYFGMLGLIKSAIDNHLIINFDELENSLHPELINHLINTYLYHSKLVGSKTQFMFTTHHIDLLAADFIRKDIVWFTNKQTDGSTNLYSLADFDIRRNLSYVNAYKTGKFGAIPNLGII